MDESLKLTLPMRATPGGYQVFPHPRHLHAVTVDDSRVDISGMTKGVYALKVTAPGRAWLEHDVAIGPEPEFAGRPVLTRPGRCDRRPGADAADGRSPAARVDPAKWHHADGIARWCPARRPAGKTPSRAARMGDSGLVRCSSGSFAVGGFRFLALHRAEVEKVTAGTEGVEVKHSSDPSRRSEPSREW